MKVNFKSLYVVPGSFESAKGTGETMHDISARKLESFLEETKPYRSKSGYSFYNNVRGDYYMAVSDRYDKEFEDLAAQFHINCYKVGKKLVRNDFPAELEFSALSKAIMKRVCGQFIK